MVEFSRPPHNYFDVGLIRQLAETYERMDATAPAGRSSCARPGSTSAPGPTSPPITRPVASLYDGGATLRDQDPAHRRCPGRRDRRRAGGGADGEPPRREPRDALCGQLRPDRHPSRVRADSHAAARHRAPARARDALHGRPTRRRAGARDRVLRPPTPAERLRDEAVALAEEIAGRPAGGSARSATMRGDLAARARRRPRTRRRSRRSCSAPRTSAKGSPPRASGAPHGN